MLAKPGATIPTWLSPASFFCARLLSSRDTESRITDGFDWITHTIPSVRPEGQPAAVQIRSWRICPASAGIQYNFVMTK
jgi:hypothetical protein